jgi:hypothetical protein
LQQALVAASKDSAERAAAVAALRGADVWAATWPTDPATLRTLTNSNGVTALAVFTDDKQLEEAAIRYGWLGLDGKVPAKRLHITDALRFARQHRAQLVVVDIAAEHSLEIDEGEMELVAATPSTRPPSYVGMPPVRTSRPPAEITSGSQSGLPPVKAPPPARVPSESALPAAVLSSRPPSGSPVSGQHSAQASMKPMTGQPTSVKPMTGQPTSVKPMTGQPASEAESVSATFGASNTATLLGLPDAPSEDMYDALTGVLREYPEVEWACLVRATRGPGEAVPSVAVRVDPAFRKNLNEISVRLREASIAQGVAFDVLLLDTPEQMKTARQSGRPFYPWRKEVAVPWRKK